MLSTQAFTQPRDLRVGLGWLLIAGMAAMYAPTLYDLLNGGLWSTGEHSHGPTMLLVALWLMWRRWRAEGHDLEGKPNAALGWALLLLGLVAFVVGRSLYVPQGEVGSAVMIVAGSFALMGGLPLLRAMSFPLLFMVFMVPLPGFLLDPISSVMKTAVSAAAVHLLHEFGYPVARSGVVISMGQYQLLVADACAGMRTLLMLEAFGILYLNVVRHSSFVRNLGLALLIVPISFSANVIRVVALAIITYHFGDEAGQGFLHDFAGLVLFVSALALTVAFDSALRVASGGRLPKQSG